MRAEAQGESRCSPTLGHGVVWSEAALLLPRVRRRCCAQVGCCVDLKQSVDHAPVSAAGCVSRTCLACSCAAKPSASTGHHLDTSSTALERWSLALARTAFALDLKHPHFGSAQPQA
eukprot:3404683-Rhodomonas_salina.1